MTEVPTMTARELFETPEAKRRRREPTTDHSMRTKSAPQRRDPIPPGTEVIDLARRTFRNQMEEDRAVAEYVAVMQERPVRHPSSLLPASDGAGNVAMDSTPAGQVWGSVGTSQSSARHYRTSRALHGSRTAA